MSFRPCGSAAGPASSSSRGILLVQRARLRIPAEWLPFVGLQGGLDALGYFAFLAGANTAAPHITMVVASAFSVVTVLLAKLIIHEPVSKTAMGGDCAHRRAAPRC